MRSRAWATWLIFTICALAVLEGLGWVTWKALDLERAEREARSRAAFQELIRLALWRMESEITPILAQEAARPYFHYQSFYPAERAYTRMLQEVSPGEVMVPSPLLDSTGPYTRVHYQVGPDGTMTSPQSPAGSLRVLAETQYIDREFLVLAGQRMAELAGMVRPAPDAPAREVAATPPAPQAAATPPPAPAVQTQTEELSPAQYAQVLEAPLQKQISDKEYQARQTLAQSANTYQENRRGKGDAGRSTERQYAGAEPVPVAPGAPASVTADKLAAAKSAPASTPAPALASKPAERAEEAKFAEKDVPRKQDGPEFSREVTDTPARIETGTPVQLRAEGAVSPGRAAGATKDETSVHLGFLPVVSDETQVEIGPFQPLWRRNPRGGTPELFVERPVNVGGLHLRQGIWMDWPAIRERLLASTRDLLSNADLVPVPESPLEAPTGQMLASFPVLLRPGAAPRAESDPLLSAPHLTLGVTWLAVLGGVVAIGAVLRTSMELSDRRGRFVSAVTHELRTPLTTFRLYTGILAGGMVKDGETQREYLATLEAESGKLAGIVENVLDYAKLGGRPARHDQPVSAADLLAQVLPSLQGSVRRCGMELVTEGEAPLGARVRADPATVERILLNLVDNACKYAQEAPDRRIHLSVGLVKRPWRPEFLEFGVRDHGPGIPGRERRRIFKAFHRARRDHLGPQTGLGLGLALSRGLARELGGELELGRSGGGAHLRLLLPVEACGTEQNT